MNTSIIIPLYNEERRLKKYFPLLLPILKKTLTNNYEIILVDDGSTDSTPQLIKELATKNNIISTRILPKNRGKGFAIKTGVGIAKGDTIFYSDIDLSVDLEVAIPEAVRLINSRVSLVSASRRLKESRLVIRQDRARQTLGKLYTNLANLVLSTTYTDFTCGFKAFDKKTAAFLFSSLSRERWSYDAEILYLAKKNSLKTAEIPVVWKNDPDTKVKLSRDLLTSFIDLFIIRFS